MFIIIIFCNFKSNTHASRKHSLSRKNAVWPMTALLGRQMSKVYRVHMTPGSQKQALDHFLYCL